MQDRRFCEDLIRSHPQITQITQIPLGVLGGGFSGSSSTDCTDFTDSPYSQSSAVGVRRCRSVVDSPIPVSWCLGALVVRIPGSGFLVVNRQFSVAG